MDNKVQFAKIRWWWLLHIIFLIVSLAVVAADDFMRQIVRSNNAQRIHKQMNETIDPCSDFYSFACGGKVIMNKFSIGSQNIKTQLRDVLSDKIDPNDSAMFNEVKKVYQDCMNTSIEADESKIIAFIDQLGGWPVVKGGEWDTKSQWNWTRVVENLRKFGHKTDFIFSFSIEADWKNSSHFIIYIDHHPLHFEGEGWTKGMELDMSIKFYYETMVNASVQLGADRNRSEVELMESLEFARELNTIYVSNEERGNFTSLYNKYSLKQLQQMYPNIQWVEYVNAWLQPTQSVDENEMVVVMVPSYVKSLDRLLQNTSNRTIANYMMWRILFDQLNELHSQEQDERWMKCIDVVSKR